MLAEIQKVPTKKKICQYEFWGEILKNEAQDMKNISILWWKKVQQKPWDLGF